MKDDQNWQIDSSVIESDGYQEPKKIKISFFDKDDDGQIDNPDSFNDIVKPDSNNSQTTYKDKFVYFKKLLDGQRYTLADSKNFYSFPTPSDVSEGYLEDGQLFYFYDPSINVVKYWSADNLDFVLAPEYFAKKGRSDLKFQYTHIK